MQLSDKTIVITGANSGIGLETSRELARGGATVVMACRDLARAKAARADIANSVPGAKLALVPLDLASLASVRACADTLVAQWPRIDVLINNAGLFPFKRQLTEDGFEMQFGVNHLAHFALTGHLLDRLTSTPGSRVHSTSSSAAFGGKINFDDLMGEKNYSRWTAYGQSKLANALFATELNRRLHAAGHTTMANSSHPGLVMTHLQENSLAQSGAPLAERVLYGILSPLLAQDINMGVLPQLYASTAPEAKGGLFYGPKTLRMRGYPAAQKCNAALADAALRTRFWQVSEALTGVAYL